MARGAGSALLVCAWLGCSAAYGQASPAGGFVADPKSGCKVWDPHPVADLELTDRLRELGTDADRQNVLFITVDPERDTPEQLALYLSSFDPRIIGLSGTEQNVAKVMTEYRALARKVPLKDGGYTMDHTATVYIMNKNGQFVGLMNYQEPDATARAKLKRLLDDAGTS
jgi:protein SCO1/2